MQNRPRLFCRGFLFLPFFQRHIVFNFFSRHLKHGKQIQVHSVPEYPQHHFGAFDFQDVFNLFDGCAARTADHFLNNRDGFVQVAIHFLSLSFIGQLPPLLNKQSRKQFHKSSVKTIFFLQKRLDNPVVLSQQCLVLVLFIIRLL
nr:MAG TPA: hypothetical protein [Caudoviricetes sp.]